MGENSTEKGIIKKLAQLRPLTDQELDYVSTRVEEIYMEAQVILSFAVDFMKKLGILNEFVTGLDSEWRDIVIKIFKERPAELGGNPFA